MRLHLWISSSVAALLLTLAGCSSNSVSESQCLAGDWQTEKKGMVRIAECGRALCGYTINPGADEKGEAVLINMKPKSAAQWTGSVYSKDTGDTYYGSINFNGPNTLRVEACALGRFYCHDNHWTRVPSKSDHVISSRQLDLLPRT